MRPSYVRRNTRSHMQTCDDCNIFLYFDGTIDLFIVFNVYILLSFSLFNLKSTHHNDHFNNKHTHSSNTIQLNWLADVVVICLHRIASNWQ